MGAMSKVIKGNGAAYVFQVVNKHERDAKFVPEEEGKKLKQQAMQAASRFMSELYMNAKIKDNRYLFF
jgi:peptidyl-prolyl cis-trans isomerase D